MVNEFNRKKILIILTIAVIIVIGIIWFIRFANGSVTIAPSTAEATVFIIEPGKSPQVAGKGKTTLRNKPGRYTVLVEHGDQATLVDATITRWKHSELSVALRPTTAAERLTNVFAQDFRIEGSRLRYLHPQLKVLYELNTTSGATKFLPQPISGVAAIEWIDFNNALILGRDNELYGLVNNRLLRIKYPSTVNEGEASLGSFPLTTNHQGEFILVVGEKTYYYKSLVAKPQELSIAIEPNTSISLSDTGLLLIYPHPPEVDPDFVGAPPPVSYDTQAAAIKVFDVKTNKMVDDSTLGETSYLQYASWLSDSDQSLLGTTSSLTLLSALSNTSELIIKQLPSPSSTALWLDPQTVVLTTGDSLWLLNTADKTLSRLFKSADKLDLPDSLLFDKSTKTIWFSTRGKEQKLGHGEIYSISID